MPSRTALALHLMLGLALIDVIRAAPLPDGSSGIAARYPFDAGIASDPAVIFADDFESYSAAAGLTSKWNQAYHTANIRIATESGNFFGGGKALEFTVPKTKLIADFPNLRLRETTALKIDRFTIDLHVGNNNLAVARKWYDNVVAATSYIGPMVSNSQGPGAPTGVRIVQ